MNAQIFTQWVKTLDDAMRVAEPLLSVPKGRIAPTIRMYQVKDAWLMVVQS